MRSYRTVTVLKEKKIFSLIPITCKMIRFIDDIIIISMGINANLDLGLCHTQTNSVGNFSTLYCPRPTYMIGTPGIFRILRRRA